jgi:hypothetical protein
MSASDLTVDVCISCPEDGGRKKLIFNSSHNLLRTLSEWKQDGKTDIQLTWGSTSDLAIDIVHRKIRALGIEYSRFTADGEPVEHAADAGDIVREAEPRPPLPRSLKVVAGLYLLSGGLALVEALWAAFQGRFYLDSSVIAIPLGVGLLRRSPPWRKLALAAAVLQILLMGLMAYSLYQSKDLWTHLLSAWVGPWFSPVVLGALSVLVAVVFVLSFWSIPVLARRDVKTLFRATDLPHRRPGLLPAVGLVLLLALIARETGGFSFDYYRTSEEGLSVRFLPDRENSRTRVGIEAPCLVDVRGMGEERYGVVTRFIVRRDRGGNSADWSYDTYGGAAVSEVPASLRDGQDRIVIEIDNPQLSGAYWTPLFKQFDVKYRAHIRGEGKYQSLRDELEEERHLTVSGPCSVYHLKHGLRERTQTLAVQHLLNSPSGAPPVPSDPEAEKLFQSVEHKLRAARTLRCWFAATLSSGRLKLRRHDGTLVLGEGGKIRLDITQRPAGGKPIPWTLVSNGTEVFVWDSVEPKQANKLGKPTLLGTDARGTLLRTGVMHLWDDTGDPSIRSPGKNLRLSAFARQGREKIGGRATQVIECTVTDKTGLALERRVRLWLDLQRNLPVQLAVSDGQPVASPHVVIESYAEFSLDIKVDGKLFVLPK